MKERLQELAYDARNRMEREIGNSRNPLSLASLTETFMPISNADLRMANTLINGTNYNGERTGRFLRDISAIGLGMKYLVMYPMIIDLVTKIQ